MKRIGVISAYRGKTPQETEANLEKARRICKRIIGIGLTPFAPHLLYPQLLDDTNPGDRMLGMACGQDFLRVCDAVWVYGEVNEGMQEDITATEEAGIPVRYRKMPD